MADGGVARLASRDVPQLRRRQEPEVSCYSSALLLKYAQEQGIGSDVLLRGVEETQEILRDPLAWTSASTWTRLAENLELALRKPQTLVDVGDEVIQGEVGTFQLVLLRSTPLYLLAHVLKSHFRTSINRLLEIEVTGPRRGQVDIVFRPTDSKKYSRQICDFNKGCARGLVKLRGYPHVQISETTCAARGSGRQCRYIVTLNTVESPSQRLLQRLLFSVRGWRTMLRVLQKSHQKLQEQYDEIVRLKDKVEASRDLYAQIMEHIGEGLVFIDDQGIVKVVNRAFCDMLLVRRRDVVSQPFASFLAPQDCHLMSHLADVRREAPPKTAMLRFVRSSGEARITQSAVRAMTPGGTVSGFLVSVRDVTENSDIRKRLSATEKRFRALYEKAPAVFFGIDFDGRFLYANPATEKLLEYTEEELLARRIADLFAEPEAHNPGILQLRERYPDGHSTQLDLVAKSCRRVTLSGNTYVAQGDNGEVIGVAWAGIDVTENCRLNDELRHAQKMEAVGRLAGSVAHDFNNLLTVLGGNAAMLSQTLQKGTEEYDQTREILFAAARAAELTGQLLAFSRKQPAKPTSLHLGEVVSGIERMLTRLIGHQVAIHITIEESLWPVMADRGQIEQVCMNLAINASDAMPGGGDLFFDIRNTRVEKSSARLDASSVPPAEYVVLAVRDTGCGMDAETQRLAFEPFFTTKRKGCGTGLGLSTVYGIVAQSAGHISLHSAETGGTTVVIHLPRADSWLEQAPGEQAPSVEPARGESVLVVEDDTSVRHFISEVLCRHGYQVHCAGNGLEALETLRVLAVPVALTISDMVMPGMGGRELCVHLARAYPDMKLILMSGYCERPFLHAADAHPNAAFIAKPVAPLELLCEVGRVLQHRVRPQGNRI